MLSAIIFGSDIINPPKWIIWLLPDLAKANVGEGGTDMMSVAPALHPKVSFETIE